MDIQELFEKYKNIEPNSVSRVIGLCDIPLSIKNKLIKLINSHHKITVDGDHFEKSIIHLASKTINSLNENEWVGRNVGKHKITRMVGSGATGVVFLGEKGGDYIQNAAIKLIDPAITKMIGEQNVLNEAQLIASLNHIGIAKIYDSGRLDGGVIYFIMEYVEGGRLSELIKNDLSLNHIVNISLKICSAIAHSHDLQITHKDIKPDNILIDKNHEIKIIDFGLSQADKSNATIDTNYFALTTEYASPEQIRREKLTSRTDIFSIGCILFEMITGDKYIDISSPQESDIDKRHNNGTLINYLLKHPKIKRKFKNTSKMNEFSAIIEKAVKADPLERYKTVDALAHDIERFAQSFPVKAYKPKNIILYQLSKFSKRNPTLVSLSLVICTSFIWFTVSTQNQLIQLQIEQTNVAQVLTRIKDVLVHADPRERLGNSISFKDVLVRELHSLQNESESNMSDHVKYELLMTIGEGLLGHSKGLDAEIAFKLAIETAIMAFGEGNIKVVAAKVKLIQAYTLNIYFEEVISMVEPYFENIFVKEFENIEYARLFIAFNKVNSRFFVDKYSELRHEEPIITLRNISKQYREMFTPIEIIDLELTILKNTFYSMPGDYASATAHVNEFEIIYNRIPILEALIPKIDNLIALARNNKNTRFLLPEILSWRARLAYETKDYDSIDLYFNESLALSIEYFEEPDYRLSSTYLAGAAIYRFTDAKRALFYAGKSLEIGVSVLNENPVEYLDNMTIYIEFVAMSGDFKGVSAEIKKAISIYDAIGLDKITYENSMSLLIILRTYLLYSHNYTHYLSDDTLAKLPSACYEIPQDNERARSFCNIVDYITNNKVNGEILASKISTLLSTERWERFPDFEAIYFLMNLLQKNGDYEISAQYIPILKKNLNWSSLEKNKSMEYFSYQSFIAFTYLKAGLITKAKIEFEKSKLILNEHYYDESAYVAIVYTGLAEIAFIEGQYIKAQQYIDKTTLSIATHFNSSTPIFERMVLIKEKLKLKLK